MEPDNPISRLFAKQGLPSRHPNAEEIYMESNSGKGDAS